MSRKRAEISSVVSMFSLSFSQPWTAVRDEMKQEVSGRKDDKEMGQIT